MLTGLQVDKKVFLEGQLINLLTCQPNQIIE